MLHTRTHTRNGMHVYNALTSLGRRKIITINKLIANACLLSTPNINSNQNFAERTRIEHTVNIIEHYVN